MDKCELDIQSERKSSRIRYTRAEILAVKKLPILSRFANPSLLRSTNVRGKPNSFSRSQGVEKPRDAAAIVLGPQKRTWNTGCHVSQQSQSRDVSHSNTTTRWPKFNSENRPYDKQHHKTIGDYKKEYRYGDARGSGRGRARASGRYAEGVSFTKNFSNEERYSRDRRVSCSHSDDEPEWFAEGPTTVDETIELGEILEETMECDVTKKCSEVEKNLTHVDDSILSSETSTKIISEKASGAESFTFPELSTKTSVGAVEHSLSDNQGSRFKHLFQKNELTDENKLPSDVNFIKSAPMDNINEKLLRLLRGSCRDSSNYFSPEKNTALQVENKLRSILLGHTHVPPSNSESKKESIGSKPKVLTVEEIEAQLKLPQGDSTSSNKFTDADASPLGHFSDPLIDDQAIKSRGMPIVPPKSHNHFSNLVTASNLVPILQSWMIRQHHKSVDSQPANRHNTHSPFGPISNPLDNSLSANVRIHPLQNPDIPLHLTCGADPPSHGFLRQFWNGTRDVTTHPRPQLHSPVFYPDASRLQPTITSDSGLPRRPIVKAQQDVFSSLNPNQMASSSIFNANHNNMLMNSSIHQGLVILLRCLERRIQILGLLPQSWEPFFRPLHSSRNKSKLRYSPKY
ncbi:eukaryotic translation initiation factor 4E transporter [Schistosoma japonicum]|nr:eukaryotic translation initiation factor 4E transporter [Schistosoma japonicum]